MAMKEMTEEECIASLTGPTLGRLACSLADQPYVVPLYFVYENGFFYALSTLGQKVDWVRANPKVCVQIDHIESDKQWVSVVATGTFEELREPQYTDEREHARKLLHTRPLWWQVPFAERQLKSEAELIPPIIFRIRVQAMSGLRAA